MLKVILRFSFGLILILIVPSFSSDYKSSPVVQVASGSLKGSILKTWTNNKYYAFKGIPYAEPPIGKLRFKPPVPIRPWKGVKDATKDGYVCPQRNPEFVNGTIDENCLFLNVYTKKLNGNQPVIIWIHPGGFRFMTGASYWYGPDYLLDHDNVLVSFNYRLDALGFLSTGDQNAVGNYGMKDQVEVLKWVQRNIKNFGGNPQKVTLAGDSAGSAAAFLHMMSPMSQGFFHNIIAMSGGIVGNVKWPSSEEQLSAAEKLSMLFNCPLKPTNKMIDCLRDIPVNEIYTRFEEREEFSSHDIFDFGPVIEKHNIGYGSERFLTEHPLLLIKKKAFSNVPVITGITEYELVRKAIGIVGNNTLINEFNINFNKYVPIMFQYSNKSQEDKQKITDSLRKFYFGNSSINNSSTEKLGQMFSDYMINYGEYATAKLLSQFSNKPVYFYKFKYQGRYGLETDPVTNKTLGPGHTNDISYLLYPSKIFPKLKENDPEAFMVKIMTSMWNSFASNGSPAWNGSVQWVPLHGSEDHYLNIDTVLTLESGLPFSDRMKLWELLFPL